MAIAGWVCFALGAVSVALGLTFGAQNAFKKRNQPGAQAVLPEAFLEVLGKLLEAPPAKFFTIVGLILIVLGLSLNGVKVF